MSIFVRSMRILTSVSTTADTFLIYRKDGTAKIVANVLKSNVKIQTASTVIHYDEHVMPFLLDMLKGFVEIGLLVQLKINYES